MIELSALTVGQVADALEAWAPPALAESYDNVGLLVGDPRALLTGVLVSLDMTEEVVEEAVSRGCNLLVAHHPIWFSARKKLVNEDHVSRAIMKAIREGVNLYAIHTNLDNVRHGVNERMAAALGLEELRILSPRREDPETGAGMIGRLPVPMSRQAFLAHVKAAFDCGGIRYSEPAQDQEIERVAICGGAGSFLTKAALQAGAEAFVTADITYHKFFENEARILLLDIGHYESEQFTTQLIAGFLSENFSTFAVHLSKVKTNPVRYFS